MHSLGKRARCQSLREFESPPLRQLNKEEGFRRDFSSLFLCEEGDEKGGAQTKELASLELGEPGEEPLNESKPKAKDEFSELTPNLPLSAN